MSAVLGGDEQAFAGLVRGLSPAMLRVATGYVGSHAVAEEVVQEAWIAVLHGLAGFQGRSSLRTWVLRICAHAAIRRSAAEGRSLPFSEVFADEGPTVDPARFHPASDRENPRAWSSPPRSWRDVPEQVLLGREARSTLQRAIETLPERQRIVICLRDVDGYTADEVCQILELSDANQRVLLHRARARLRATLETYLEST